MKYENMAWAVRIKEDDDGHPPFLAGRYWFHQSLHASHAGCLIALFETRAAAQQAIRKEEIEYATPVRVRVTVQEIPRKRREEKP